MACCGGTAGGCRCVIQPASDDGCRAVSVAVTGAGSVGSPYSLAANLDLNRLVRLDGDEPWAVGLDGSCPILVPRCAHEMIQFMRMANSVGTFAGYSWLELDCVSGLASPTYQALGTTTTTSTKPTGWEPFCTTESASPAYPMFSTADDPTTLVGYVWLDETNGVITQQYQTLAGSLTHTLPAGWHAGACGSTTGGGGGGGTSVASVPATAHAYFSTSMVQVGYFPDWGISDLPQARRKDKLLLPPGYTTADWVRFAVVLENVTAPLVSAFTIELLNLTDSTTIASITIAAGTSPTANEIFRSINLVAGSFDDDTNIQWHITAVESGNSFGCHAWGFYNLNVESAS